MMPGTFYPLNTAQSGRERHLGDKSRRAGRLSWRLSWQWGRIVQGMAKFFRALPSGHAAPAREVSSASYAGMGLEPSDFSNQLCKLQMSLQRECSPEENLSNERSSAARN